MRNFNKNNKLVHNDLWFASTNILLVVNVLLVKTNNLFVDGNALLSIGGGKWFFEENNFIS